MFTAFARIAGALCFALFSSVAAADDCKLARVAQLDMSEIGYRAIFIPVSIAGTTRLMLIDTGSPLSAVEPQAVSEFHLVTHRIFSDSAYNFSGDQFKEMAEIPSIQIGQMHADNLHFLVWPSQMINDPRVAGTLGADLLRHYDIDIDFAAKKLSLFSQDHCPGQVVYWPADAVAVVPMHVVNSGHIIVPVALEGHDMNALLDTGASRTILSLETAENIFGLKPNTPELTSDEPIDGAKRVTTYRHIFKTISLKGITINHPDVLIFDDLAKYGRSKAPPIGSRLSDEDVSNGVTDFTLGMNELQNFHLYIAYREQKLYITAGTPTVAPLPQAAQAAATK